MKLWLALFLAFTTLLVGDEAARESRIVAALAEAEKAAAAEQWSAALAAGNRLWTLTREEHGEEHSDTALAELFLGEVRDHLGEPALAEAHFRRALAIQEMALGSEAPERVATLTRLAALLKNARRLDEAAGLLRRALDLQIRIQGADEIETAVASTNLARVLRTKEDFAEAAALLERAVAIQRRVLGGSDIETIASLRELALAQEQSGALAAAERSAGDRAVAVEAHFGVKSPELASALSEWGRLAERQEHFTAAEPRYRRAMAIAGEAFLVDHPAHAAVLAQLGWCLRNLERYDEARPLLERALEMRLRVLGPDHPDTAWSFSQLGWVLRLKRDFDGARGLFEKALAIREKVLGANDPLTLLSLGELGDLHWLRGAFDEAASLLETKRYRVEAATGPASVETAAAWHGLAIVYESAKRWSEATQAAVRSLTLTDQWRGPADPQTLGEMLLLSRICGAAGAFAPALTQFARLATWFRQHAEASPAIRAELLRQFSQMTLRAGRADEAAPLFRESLRVHEIAFGPSHAATLRSLGDLWTFYDETRQPKLALETGRELAARSEVSLGQDAPATAEVFDRLARLCLATGDRDEAAGWFRRSLEARRRHFGDGSPELLDALAQAAAAFQEIRDFKRAVAFRTERLAAVGRKFGQDSIPTEAACGDLALCYFRQRDLAAARGLFERQLELLTEQAGADSVDALTAVARLGDVAMASRDWPRAVAERERLAEGCARRFGAEHPERGRALLLLGEALLARGSDLAAEKALRESHRLVLSAERQDALRARVACGLARARLRRGDREEAKRWTRDALAGSFSNEEPLAEAFSLLGEAWSGAGDDSAGEGAFTGALMILTQVAGDQDEHTLALLEQLGKLRLRLGRSGAASLLERALNASEALNGAETSATESVLGWLALAQAQEKQFALAHGSAQRLLALARKTHGEGSPQSATAAMLEAWTAMGAADSERWGSAAERLAEVAASRWGWLRLW